VTVLGWHVGVIGDEPAAQLATAPVAAPETTAAASVEPSVMLRDARLDELLAAHRQFGGTSALQTPAGFLRNATFEQPGR
jgi:sigma-E factor negative regulatory protein RseA